MGFAQVGKVDHLEIIPSCRLPGLKQEANEIPMDTMQRLLATKLRPLAGKVDLVGCSTENVEGVSKEYQVETRYGRTIFSADMRTDALIDSRIRKFLDTPAQEPSRESSRTSRTRVSVANANVPKPKFEPKFEHEVFVFEADDQLQLYTWLSLDQFELSSGALGEAFLKDMLT